MISAAFRVSGDSNFYKIVARDVQCLGADSTKLFTIYSGVKKHKINNFEAQGDRSHSLYRYASFTSKRILYNCLELETQNRSVDNIFKTVIYAESKKHKTIGIK